MGIERIREQVFCQEVETELENIASRLYGKDVKDLSDTQVYDCVLQMTKEFTRAAKHLNGDKKVYYISAEFLIGKLLANNLRVRY